MAVFDWWTPGEEDYVRQVTALDAEDAATTAAERYHSNGGGEWSTGKQEFVVRDEAGVVTTWSVEIDYSPFFSAWQLEPKA